MSTSRIKISELRSEEGADAVEELAEFLEKKLEVQAETTSSDITLSFEEGTERPSRGHLRVLLRKFLHQAELKEWFRVISGEEDAFIIKARKA
jgi:hypothetical protein